MELSAVRLERQTHDLANQDATTKTAEYGGCGCAGGEQVTLTDEMGRQQKVFHDALGRVVKTQVLNTDPEHSVYAQSLTAYNALDQVTSVIKQAGTSGAVQTTSLTYDGYARLQTQQLPVQASPTVYTYNPDDTVHTLTDARGATQTLTYNARHLVTNITYSVAPNSGITATPSVTFEYDAAGNRTQLTQGSGGQSNATYHYNQLSQMEWEERTFTGLNGSYRLTYEYTLAGSLKSVTDPALAKVEYAYDPTGHLKEVTNVNFTNYAGLPYRLNLQYRASGALKHLDYGNYGTNGHTLDITYNSRQQVASFAISDTFAKTYDYAADGRLAHVFNDAANNKFDRAYEYDHLGRISKALSGAEAHDETVPTNVRPYKQSFQYDAFDHLTARPENKLWAGNGGDFYPAQQSYLNDRNTAWQYDDEGHLVQNDTVSYAYDVAGRILSSTSNQTDLTQSFDGDGQSVKREEVDHYFDDNLNPQEQTTITYFVRSSVLSGKVLTELNASGAKQRTLVYAAGEVIAWQVQQGTSQTIKWEHRDPSGASFRMTDIFNQPLSNEAAELDPLGQNAGVRNPSSPHPIHKPFAIYPSYGDGLGSGGTQCLLDGVESSCSDVLHLTSVGAATITLVARTAGVFNGVHLRPVQVNDPETYGPVTTEPGDPNAAMTIQEHWHYEYVPDGVMTTFINPHQIEPQNNGHQQQDDCHRFADIVAELAEKWIKDTAGDWAYDASGFRDALYNRFNNNPGRNRDFGSTGFRPEFRDDTPPGNSPNQVYHYVGAFRAGFAAGRDVGGVIMEEHETERVWVPGGPMGIPYPITLPDTPSHKADKALNQVAVQHGSAVNSGFIRPNHLADAIRRDVCVK